VRKSCNGMLNILKYILRYFWPGFDLSWLSGLSIVYWGLENWPFHSALMTLHVRSSRHDITWFDMCISLDKRRTANEFWKQRGRLSEAEKSEL
jgi:hypothetical protein